MLFTLRGEGSIISQARVTQILHVFHTKHWKIDTVAAALGLQSDTVRAAWSYCSHSRPGLRDRLTDPYLDFLRQTLQQHSRLRCHLSL